jgi:hypothetical protein
MADEETPPNKGGRPSSYKPEYAVQAQKLCLLGATDVELADFFGVSDRTIYRWQIEFPEFCQALKSGKEAADERVERSLYHKATGYTFDSEKVFQFQGQIVRAPVREHVPPDTTAAIFWLKNRRKEQWRDRHEIEHKHEYADDLTDDQLANLVNAVREAAIPSEAAGSGTGQAGKGKQAKKLSPLH